VQEKYVRMVPGMEMACYARDEDVMIVLTTPGDDVSEEDVGSTAL
jgi:hypothetical protein